MSYNYYKVLH